MIERLESIEAKYNEITKELTTPEVLNNVKTLTELSKKQSSLEDCIENCINSYSNNSCKITFRKFRPL